MITQSMGRRAALQGAGAAALAFAFAGLRGPAAFAAAKGPAVAEDIARWLVALRYEDVPANVVARAKRIVLDTIGCAMGGLGAEPVRMARSVVALQGGNAQASLIGIGGKVSADQAAFLNGMALRYLDYNDYIALGRPHHASINVAPALAIAELQAASGKDMLLGFIAGYELEVRLRDAIAAKELEGWDGTSIVAQYASAATAAKLLRLDARKIANALAIAGSNANTLGEVRRGAEMTPAKGSAEPMAARNGVFAALLAREGLEYPLTMLDGQYGYGKMVPGVLDEAVLRRREGDFQILKSCIKLWPCVGTAQAPIAAALAIYKQQPRADEIERITVSLSDFAYKQQIAYPEVINTREHADHSVPYLVARALLDGAVGVNDFDEARFKDPRAIAVMKRIALRSEPSLSNTDIGANIEAVARGGAVLKANVPIPPGAMQNPPDDAALSKKFLALSEPVLGHARAEAAVDVILSVELDAEFGDTRCFYSANVMFRRETVFVLGAGASWHYGYPLGERLVGSVIKEARSLASFYQIFRGQGQFMPIHVQAKVKQGQTPVTAFQVAQQECETLASRLLQLNPPVIDYFLGQNPELREVGGLLIALSILKAEAKFLDLRINHNRKPITAETLDEIFRTSDDWCRFLNYQLAIECKSAADVLDNNVSFITFNYDTSLEREIASGLEAIQLFRSEDVVTKFLEADRVIHVYGKVGNYREGALNVVQPPKRVSDSMAVIEPYVKMINRSWSASSQIRTMSDGKDGDGKDIAIARDKLRSADYVYILGYGFDQMNSERIGLDELSSPTRLGLERVAFTNWQDSNKINKRAGALLTGIETSMLSYELPIAGKIEKSIRDVYGALNLDFELPN